MTIFDLLFIVSSRARRRAQRERGLRVYLMDDRGRRFEPALNPAAVPFDVMLNPQEAMNITGVFEVPPDAHDLVLIVSHGGGFPGCCIIGESGSLFHKRTVVRLN